MNIHSPPPPPISVLATALSTTRRYLFEQGLFGSVTVKKPFIRKQNRKRRLTFAKEHKDWTKDDWNKVLWTDKSKFELFGTNRRVYMCDDAQVSGSLTTAFSPTVKHGGGNIMVWGSEMNITGTLPPLLLMAKS